MKLELYHRQACPFSAKVRAFVERHDLQSYIEYHDVNLSKSGLDQLLMANRNEQVPCLMVDGEPILESDPIISWLDENLIKRSLDLVADRRAS